MAVTRARKEEILAQLKTSFGNAKTVTFVRNNGLSVSQLQDLRGKLRSDKAEMHVAKKTLIKLALKEHNIDVLDDAILEGPIGAAFSFDDQVGPTKTLFQFSKTNDKLELMGGIMDGRILSKEEITTLAKLPSKLELIAQLVGTMKAPISGFHGVLNGTLGGFVRVVDQIRSQKEQSA